MGKKKFVSVGGRGKHRIPSQLEKIFEFLKEIPGVEAVSAGHVKNLPRAESEMRIHHYDSNSETLTVEATNLGWRGYFGLKINPEYAKEIGGRINNYKI